MIVKTNTDCLLAKKCSVLFCKADIRTRQKAVSDCRGFTLIELIVVSAVLGVLATLALPAYSDFKKLAKNARCAADIRTIDKAIMAHVIDTSTLPVSLSTLKIGTILDPWGNAFEYHNLDTAINPGAIPLQDSIGPDLNTDYDLYSRGNDGAGTSLLGIPANDTGNNDDIVRSNDGAFVGMRP